MSFTATPGRITSVIGPNGAGKTTVLNMIGGFYRPDTGSIRLGDAELAGAPAWRIARAGIARTYQTTQLFGTMSVLDNVLVALRRGRLGNPLGGSSQPAPTGSAAEALLAFVGYHGPLAALAGDLPHVDRRLVEIARALATRPQVLLLDEPAAGLMRADKAALSKLIRRIADLGIAVILVEHDMALVMGISDHIVVLDAGSVIAAGTPAEVRRDPRVLKAYLGGGEMRARPRAAAWSGSQDAILSCLKLSAGYGAAPVLEEVSFEVRPGEMVALLGANGAGKSTTMRAVTGLLRPVTGSIVLDDQRVEQLAAHRIAASGVALVPEGRQVFPELSVRDNIMLGAHTRQDVDREAELAALLRTLSAPARTAVEPRRAAVRRRAADAGDRARPDGEAAHPAARRAVARPRARDDQRAVRRARRAARRRRHHPAGRPDGGAGADRRRPRLCAGIRPHRARRHRRRAGPRSGAGSRLSRPRRGGAVAAMPLDLVLRNARIAGRDGATFDIGIAGGRIAEIAQSIATDAPAEDVGGRLVTPGFVETHIHLDKSCILDRCRVGGGHACRRRSRRSPPPSAPSPRTTSTQRGSRTLEKAIVQGTTRMRTHVEVDPRIGLTSFDAIRRLKRDYAWAIDLEICVFPQEGLLNDPGTEELLVAACEAGADLIGGCPYTDSDPHGQIARIFEIARRFDLDIDFHLDFDLDASRMHLDEVCRQTAAHPLRRPRRGRPRHQAVGAAAGAAGRSGAAPAPMPASR